MGQVDRAPTRERDRIPKNTKNKCPKGFCTRPTPQTGAGASWGNRRCRGLDTHRRRPHQQARNRPHDPGKPPAIEKTQQIGEHASLTDLPRRTPSTGQRAIAEVRLATSRRAPKFANDADTGNPSASTSLTRVVLQFNNRHAEVTTRDDGRRGNRCKLFAGSGRRDCKLLAIVVRSPRRHRPAQLLNGLPGTDRINANETRVHRPTTSKHPSRIAGIA